MNQEEFYILDEIPLDERLISEHNYKNKLLTAGKAAEYLGISKNKIYEWSARRIDRLPSVRLPNTKTLYFTISILDKYIQDHTY